MPIVKRIGKDCVQQHSTIVWQDSVGRFEERGISRLLECLERADADNAIDWFVELLPALQPDLHGSRGGYVRQPCPAVLTLVAAQGNPDDVDVIPLHRQLQRTAPAASDVQ